MSKMKQIELSHMNKVDRKLLIKQICAEELEEYRTKKAIKSPEDVYHACITEAFMDKECVIALALDSANKLISKHEVSKGTVNRSIVSARDIMKECIMDSAVAFIIVHNHPSGSLLLVRTKQLQVHLNRQVRYLVYRC